MKFKRIEEIAARLESCAVIGAYAMIARGYVRFTRDFDLLTADAKALLEETWERERSEGMSVEVHRGDFDDPLRGVARIRARELKLDVVVAKYKWQAAVIARATPMKFEGIEMRVPRISDLVSLKIDAGGNLDLHDAIALLGVGGRREVTAELEALLPTLPEPLQRRVTEFLAQNSSSIG